MSQQGLHDTIEPADLNQAIHPDAMRILIAYDGSAHAQAAIALAEDRLNRASWDNCAVCPP